MTTPRDKSSYQIFFTLIMRAGTKTALTAIILLLIVIVISYWYYIYPRVKNTDVSVTMIEFFAPRDAAVCEGGCNPDTVCVKSYDGTPECVVTRPTFMFKLSEDVAISEKTTAKLANFTPTVPQPLMEASENIIKILQTMSFVPTVSGTVITTNTVPSGITYDADSLIIPGSGTLTFTTPP